MTHPDAEADVVPAPKDSRLTLWLCVSLYFSHWLGIAAMSAFVAAVFVLALGVRTLRGRIRKDAVYVLLFLACYSAIVLVLQRPTWSELRDWSPTETPRLLVLGVGPLLVFALLGLMRPMSARQFERFLMISYYVLAGTIAGEWILVNVVGVSNTWMPGFRDVHAYYIAFGGFFRPFGLTGNASVNGALLVLAAWLLVFSGATRHAGRYIVATGVVLVLDNSGQAWLTYVCLAGYYLLRGRRPAVILWLFLPFVAATAVVVWSGRVDKFSLSYMANVYQYTGFESIALMDWTGRVFGGYSRYAAVFDNPAFTTEFYPVYTLSRFGIVLTAATWAYIFTRLPRVRRGAFFALLLVATAHYPTMLFVEAQVLIGAYLLWAPRTGLVSEEIADV